jgi:hypothetical protein
MTKSAQISAVFKSFILAAFKTFASLLLPTLLECRRANHKVIKDPDDAEFRRLRDSWIQVLEIGSPGKREAVSIAYQDTVGRIATLESKSIGVLQAIAIAAAGAFVALTGTGISIILASIGLLYLTTAGWACCSVLLPRNRWSLGIDNVKVDPDSYSEMAAVTEAMKGLGIRTSNLVTSAVYDLIRGFTLTLAALVAFVSIGHFSAGSRPAVRSPLPSATSTSPKTRVPTKTESSKASSSSSQPRPRPVGS